MFIILCENQFPSTKFKHITQFFVLYIKEAGTDQEKYNTWFILKVQKDRGKLINHSYL